MGASDTEREPIYVFEIDGEHLFSHHFQRTGIFSGLSEYYHDDEYRFEQRLRESLFELIYEGKVDEEQAKSLAESVAVQFTDALND
jgi:hypothetical protein